MRLFTAADEADPCEGACAEDEVVDRRRGRFVEETGEARAAEGEDEAVVVESPADGIVLMSSCKEVRAASGLPVPPPDDDEGDEAVLKSAVEDGVRERDGVPLFDDGVVVLPRCGVLGE